MKTVALTLTLFGIVAGASAADLRAQIAASNKSITSAMQKKDFPTLIKAMKAGMTKDFVYIENGQKQTFDQMVANMKMGLSSMSTIKLVTTKVLTLKEKGSEGTALIHHTMSGLVKGPDGKPHTMTFEGRSTDTYRKEGGKWKMSKMVWAAYKMTMDGKPMNPGAPAGGK